MLNVLVIQECICICFLAFLLVKQQKGTLNDDTWKIRKPRPYLKLDSHNGLTIKKNYVNNIQWAKNANSLSLRLMVFSQ